jgi:hypothetical protein
VLGIPGQAELGTGYVNASVAMFVDTAWCWYGVNTALRALPLDEVTFQRLGQFWTRVRESDPTVDLDPSVSLWHGLVAGW